MRCLARGPIALCASLTVFLVTLTGAAPVGAQTSISLIAISESGLWGPDLDRIESGLRQKVSALGAFEVQSKADTVENFAEARDLGIDCQARDVECATKIGLIAGADKVLLLRAAPKEGSFYLTLLLVDVDAPESPIRVTQWAPTSGTGFETAIEEASVRLFASDRHRGSLKIQLTPSSATVMLDGAAATIGEDGVINDIMVGDHSVLVQLPGYRAFSGSVQVRFKETSALRVSLEPVENGAKPTAPVQTSDPATKPEPPSDRVAPNPTGDDTAADPAAEGGGPSPLDSPLVLGGGAAVGLGVAGVIAGGLLALAAVGVVDDLSNDLETRELWQGIGLGGLAASVLSGVVVVTGGAAIAWGLVDAPPAE